MSKHDEKVKTMLDVLEKKRKELGTRPSGVLVTNGLLKFTDKDHININAITDIKVAANSLALILENKSAYENACKALGIESEYNYGGYSIEDWITDLKLRVKIIQWNAKQAEFNAISKKLDGLISEDLRTEKELGDIESLLSK